MASCFRDMLWKFTEFSFCKSGSFPQFTGRDLVFLLEEPFQGLRSLWIPECLPGDRASTTAIVRRVCPE
ncbi:hypothetical protein EVAR_18446_1 [Eumeta japonica]|uniref:Uncharacterized protein n=1 Tax=Eumeta variegata TaxID=151549 RepID=A0A4C1UZK0_EUMVA|nr:hypothetical protein EVAR_18446_1 [Eumeta japonica]